MRKIEYQKGEKVGDAIFIKRTSIMLNKQWKALFRCKCGKEFEASIAKVKNNSTRSCGCYNTNRITKHKKHNSVIYHRWENMIQRCTNPKTKRYKHYGGRGITICDEWRNNFISFYNYVMSLSNALSDGYTIDRIDNNGNYEPGNIRWATYSEQNKNRNPYKWGV